MKANHSGQTMWMTQVRGATMTEFLVIVPSLLMLGLGIVQIGLNYHAKNNLNLAAFEAARAGSISNAKVSDMKTAFAKAMVGYFGGGNDAAELAKTFATKVMPDLAPSANLPEGPLRIEIISPTKESFDDYQSPALAKKMGVSARVLPLVRTGAMNCPTDRANCKQDPANNASGQTLADANLLKVRITYGIPAAKQVPFVGRFYTWALGQIGVADDDAFRRALIAARRIPVVAHTTVRMQSEAIENSAMLSIPGPGNNGTPKDPGTVLTADLPPCAGGAVSCGDDANTIPNPKTINPSSCESSCCAAGNNTVTTEESVSADVLFDFDSAALSASGKAALDAMIEQAKENPPLEIVVAGYTDQIGAEAYNMALSQKRAETVANYLKASGVFNNTKIVAVGMGENDPKVPESACPGSDVQAKAACLAANRRVEFTITSEVK